MNTPLLTWGAVILMLMAVFATRLFKTRRSTSGRHHRWIGTCSESENLFIPGDRLRTGDYDYDEFDDI